jgi:hypothetical protein
MTDSPAPQVPRPAPPFSLDQEQLLAGLMALEPVERERVLAELEAELDRADRLEQEDLT